MASFTYQNLKTQYGNFAHPVAVIQVNGKDISKNKDGLAVTDIEVEMTSGFEASVATFWIYNCYDRVASEFLYDTLKPYILLGSSVVISLGYDTSAREIFRGFISRVNFSFGLEFDMPGVEVTAMDVKGIMMANSYSKQLQATCFSDAVKEVLQKTAYMNLQTSQIITSLEITDTPDKSPTGGTSQGSKASDRTIEMVCESDYEFVVKAAKKYNYDFFSIGGTVYFRKAKSNSEVLMEVSPSTGMRTFQVEYDITGLVETVEVRTMDVGKSKVVYTSKKMKNKLSQGNKAKSMISKSQRVYIDPTVASKEEAGYRADYLTEDISYRLGTLEAEFTGLPELTPGRFIELKSLGTAVSNKFYLVTVRHIMDTERGFVTRVTGKTASM